MQTAERRAIKKIVDIDIDPNDGSDHFVYQLSDDRLYLVVWVNKSRLPQTRAAIAALREGDEVVFGEINSGAKVWIIKEAPGYLIAIGDSDGKDLSYPITEADLAALLSAEPT